MDFEIVMLCLDYAALIHNIVKRGQRKRGDSKDGVLTLGELRDELAVVVGGLALPLTDVHHLLHVPPHVRQQLRARVHLALKEAEQRVLDVLHRAPHWHDLLLDGKTFVGVNFV